MFAATLAFITSYNWPKKCQVIQITESCPWCCVRRGRSHNHETVPSTAGLKRPLPKYLACHIQRWDGDEEVANGYSHFLMGLFYLCPTENRKKQTHCIDHNHGHIGAPWAKVKHQNKIKVWLKLKLHDITPLAAAFPIRAACGCSNSCSANELTSASWRQSTRAPGSCGTWGCKCSRSGQGTQAGCKRHDFYGCGFLVKLY